jgi:hypothetical protein
MTEGEAFKLIDDALSALEPDAQARILAWANTKFGSSAVSGPSSRPSATPAVARVKAPSKNKNGPSGTKRSKTTLKIDKTIDLFPTDKQSATEFAAEKAPSSIPQKGVIAVYYILEIIELEDAAVGQVAAFFQAVNWPLPADLPNALQQAGSKGWLDTKNSDDLKLTPLGYNLVRHELPQSKAG